MILNVIGSKHEVQEGKRSLLEVLRDDLGLVGVVHGPERMHAWHDIKQ